MKAKELLEILQKKIEENPNCEIALLDDRYNDFITYDFSGIESYDAIIYLILGSRVH